MKEKLTVRQSIDQVAETLIESGVFFGHGTDNAWDEAIALVLYALELPFSVSTEDLNRYLTQDEQSKIDDWLKKRIHDRIPLAYLTKETYFFDLPFYVDERVLIPRSPIAELIEYQFSPWVNPEKVENILDLCTGSGCIAIACAMMFEYAHVDAVDIDPDALEVAKINVDKHNMKDQVHLIQSDLFDKVTPRKYDIIVSNPPYVSAEELNTVPKEYHHEPRHALEAEQKGLDIVFQILKESKNYLADKGVLIVEVGNTQEALEAALPDVPFLWLEFEKGGQGVFLLTAAQVKAIEFEKIK